jgi:cyclophilin family peptidyl-prolyl cis-trans isomerase
MWDRIWIAPFAAKRRTSGLDDRTANRSRRRPLVEVLEGRQLLTASLAPITSISVPAQLGYQVSLNGSGDTTQGTSQTFTVTSDNPRIAATVASGPFWTLNVQHTASSPTDISFAGALVFQLFNDLTPMTVAQITNFTNSGFYSGKFFSRVLNGFPGPMDFVAQGGAVNPNGTGSTPFPNFPDEFVQQLAFTGTQQLAMANAGPNTNNTQFFVTTGTPTFLDFMHTVFGQLVAGSSILAQMTQVATKPNPPPDGPKSEPVNPIVINSAVLSNSDVNGVIHINTNSARKGDTANITVTAKDTKDGTTATQSFKVTVVGYTGPTTNPTVPINFVPFANDVSSNTAVNSPVTIQLSGQSGYPDTTTPGTLSFKLLSQPAHGTISQFNASTGSLLYTPNKNYFGPDSFQYQVNSTGPKTSPNPTTSLPAAVNVFVGAINTGAVRLINNVLVVTPPPKSVHGKEKIVVTQLADSSVSGGQKIVVLINDIPDLIQPASNSLDEIVVFGNKASDNILVEPEVTVPTTLDGGHGGHNVVHGGGGPTTEHGWFGHTLLVGGTGQNMLIGRKGLVRFKPSAATTEIFAGVPKHRTFGGRAVPPDGTFYRFVKGHLVPIVSLHNLKPHPTR